MARTRISIGILVLLAVVALLQIASLTTRAVGGHKVALEGGPGNG